MKNEQETNSITDLKDLLLQRQREAKTLTSADVPSQQGLYVWYLKNTGEVFYVGKATGKAGLRKRICGQHLNAKYLESRPGKFRVPEDDFQRRRAMLLIGKDCVDQSVFRRSIGRRFQLAPGEETVQYIKDNLMVAWLTADDLIGEIPIHEKELIRELKPMLNVSGNAFQALRNKTPAQIRADVEGFVAKYVQDWDEWLAASTDERPQLFGRILRKWQAARPGAVRWLRAEAPDERLSLDDLLAEAEESLRVLADLSVATIRERTSAQQDALHKLWSNFSRLRTSGVASCVGISKAILLLTDGRIGPAFDSRVRRNLGVDRPATCSEWLQILEDIAEDITGFERAHGPLKGLVPIRFAHLAYGRLYDMVLGPRQAEKVSGTDYGD